jgi:hypothetical protein
VLKPSGLGRDCLCAEGTLLPRAKMQSFSMSSAHVVAAILPQSTVQQIVGWGLLVLILLFSNIVAAKVFVPKANTLHLLAASVLQVVFVGCLVVTVMLIPVHGWTAVGITAAVIFVIWALVNGGIYRFPFPVSLGYTAIAAIAMGLALWGFHLFVEVGYFQRITGWKWKSPILEIKGRMNTGTKMVEKSGSRSFSTVEEAQAAAVQRYPELGVAGSVFNQRFVEKYNHYKANAPGFLATPNWPWLVAAQVAAELGQPYSVD